MRKNGRSFRECIMRFSYQERRKRRLEGFREELERLRSMDKDERCFEYTELMSEYEHKKNVLAFFLVSVALAVLMDIWSRFFSFMELAIQYAVGSSNVGAAAISFWISVSVLAFITLLVFFFLFASAKELAVLRKRLMMVENVIKETAEDEQGKGKKIK